MKLKLQDCSFLNSAPDAKLTKQNMADYYGVSRKTLDKWVRYFTDYDYENYKPFRKFSKQEFLKIFQQLGTRNDMETCNKMKIKKICETRYQTIRDNVTFQKCGITREIYLKMNIFPPIVYQRIVDHLGGY